MSDSHGIPNRLFGKVAAVFTATAVSLVASATVYAAELQTGEWAGTVAPPESDATAATFTVGEADGQIQISVAVFGMTFDFRDIEISDDGIAFTWSPGVEVRCELDLQEDRSYAGACIDTDGGTGHITMVPPA